MSRTVRKGQSFVLDVREVALIVDGLDRLREHLEDLADTDMPENRAAWLREADEVRELGKRLEAGA